MNEISRETVIDRIKREILLGRLELNDVGITMDDLKNDIPLLGEEGLNLDSVDALDIIVSIQQMFGFKIDSIDREFVLNVCKNIDSIADYACNKIIFRNECNKTREAK